MKFRTNLRPVPGKIYTVKYQHRTANTWDYNGKVKVIGVYYGGYRFHGQVWWVCKQIVNGVEIGSNVKYPTSSFTI